MERDFSVFDEGVTVSTLSMLKELASESKDLLHAQESMFNQRNEADLNKMAAQVKSLKKVHESLREQLAKNQFKTLKEIIVTELGERKVPAFKNRELPEGEEFVIQTHLKKRKLDETRTAYMLSGNMLQWEGDELAVRFETFYLGSYYEHYYIFLKFNSTQETFSIKHHTIPFFIPLDGAVKKYLNSNFKLFLEKIKHYLNSYVARREQEIIFRIFTHLSAQDLLLSVSRVCSLWYAFSKDDPLWRPLCLRSWGYLKRTINHTNNPTMSWIEFFKSNFDKSNLSFLVIGAEGGGDKDERLEDVKSKLISFNMHVIDTGKFRHIDHELGNLLAQYVDDGGGVVIGTYSNCGRGNRLEGRWSDFGYDPITLGSTSRTKALSVGKSIPNHPILRGVRNFNGGTQSSHGDGKPHPDANIVAEWANGRPLIAELTKFTGTVVGLNFYPPSSDVAEGCWCASSSDGKILISNSLYYVSFANKMR